MNRTGHVARLYVVLIALATISVCALAPGVFADGPSSISGAGQGNWTTPQGPSQFNDQRYTARPAPVPSYGNQAPLPPAQPLPGSALSTGPRWIEVPAPAAELPVAPVEPALPFAPVAPIPCDPIPAPAVAPAAAFCGGLPCNNGCSEWHIRALGGRSFKTGDDPADLCLFAGVDIGRTFCGCWGLDLYYRYHSGQFDREGWTTAAGAPISEDGGNFHHVGLKVTTEREFGRNSRWYWWAGLGAGYYWSEDYIDDEDGFEVFAEFGVGYMLNRNVRIRGGLNAIVMDTAVGRKNIANAGVSRTHWILAPVIGVEFDF